MDMIIQENEYKLYLYGFQLKCVLSYFEPGHYVLRLDNWHII